MIEDLGQELIGELENRSLPYNFKTRRSATKYLFVSGKLRALRTKLETYTIWDVEVH